MINFSLTTVETGTLYDLFFFVEFQIPGIPLNFTSEIMLPLEDNPVIVADTEDGWFVV